MRATALPRAAAMMGEVAGRPVAMSYGDVAAEYGAIRRGALLVDRSHRGRMTMRGPKAAETLTGLVTNDITALVPGQGLYAAALTPKGKIVADVRVLSLGDDALLVDCPPRAAAGWLDMVHKYVNPRLAAYTDDSATLGTLGVFGVQARRVAAEATGAAGLILGGLPMYGHVTAEVEGARVIVARTPELGVEGYEMFAPVELVPALWRRLADAGATPAGLESWEIGRIEAGRPEWGLDVDDTTIPQEANFDDLHAISYTKGCYVGQETVARVHFRGHVNKHLRGLRFVTPAPPAPRAQLIDDGGKTVGDARSAAVSPRLGGVAIGMVRREVAIGTTLAAVWDGGECQVEVAYLPFPL